MNKRVQRNILSQGDRDGACLLYSLANAKLALTGKGVTPKAWSDSFDSLPFTMGEFLTQRGSGKLDDHPGCLELLGSGFLAGIGLVAKVEWSNKFTSVTRLRKYLRDGQLVILVIDDGKHWVTAVDATNSEVFLACSSEALEGAGLYEERCSPNLGRTFNRCVCFEGLKATGMGLVVSTD